MRVKLLVEKEDQKKREAELEQQHSDLTVIYHAVSHSIMHASQSIDRLKVDKDDD